MTQPRTSDPTPPASSASVSPPDVPPPSAVSDGGSPAAVPRRFERFRRLALRASRSAARQKADEDRMEKLIEADRQERTRRERRRAMLIGTWMLLEHRGRFIGPDQDAGFRDWLEAAAARRADAPMFAPDADVDLLDQKSVDTLLEQAARDGAASASADSGSSA